jgi:hypothetical protein
MSKSPYISCQKCAPFVYGEENEMTIQAQSSKHPRKKIEEEIVTERRGCFTSEELGQWWRRGRGARSPPENGGDRPEKWGHASAGNRPEKWGHASAGNQPEKKSWRSPENGGDWPENGGTHSMVSKINKNYLNFQLKMKIAPKQPGSQH